MLYNTTLEYNAIFPALGDKPWKIYGSIDTNRREHGSRVNARLELFLRQFFELDKQYILGR